MLALRIIVEVGAHRLNFEVERDEREDKHLLKQSFQSVSPQ